MLQFFLVTLIDTIDRNRNCTQKKKNKRYFANWSDKKVSSSSLFKNIYAYALNKNQMRFTLQYLNVVDDDVDDK